MFLTLILKRIQMNRIFFILFCYINFFSHGKQTQSRFMMTELLENPARNSRSKNRGAVLRIEYIRQIAGDYVAYIIGKSKNNFL